MRLSDWLRITKTRRGEFAARIGVSAGYVTQLCNHHVWPGKDVASRIREATNGDVTADDFLPERADHPAPASEGAVP